MSQFASRTTSQTEPVAARTRQSLGSDPEVSAFADMNEEKTLNEWLHEIAFVTSTMSDPDEPCHKASKKLGGILICKPEKNGERLFTWSSRRCWTWVFGDM